MYMVRKRTCTWLTGDKQDEDAVCAFKQAYMHVVSGYEQDTWRILMQIAGEQAQLVTSKSSWMEGRMLYKLPPGSPSIPRPYKSRYTCTQQIKTTASASA